ncbi:MAG TPA: hypothetical protein VIJ34_01160 [Acidimicrobiales bacterium]
MDDGKKDAGVIGSRLRLGPGLAEKDREEVVVALSALGRHLEHWKPDQVDLRVSVRDRGFGDQRVSLEVWLPGRHSLLAHAADADLNRALVEVRKVAIRELEDFNDRR